MLRIIRRPSPRAIHHAGLALAVAVAFLLLFRPAFAFRPSWGGVDDECYKAWLAWMVGGENSLCHSNSYLPGIALVWLPAGAVARWVNLHHGGSLQNQTAVAIGLTSFLCWALGLFLIASILRRQGERKWGLDAILLQRASPSSTTPRPGPHWPTPENFFWVRPRYRRSTPDDSRSQRY